MFSEVVMQGVLNLVLGFSTENYTWDHKKYISPAQNHFFSLFEGIFWISVKFALRQVYKLSNFRKTCQINQLSNDVVNCKTLAGIY